MKAFFLLLGLILGFSLGFTIFIADYLLVIVAVILIAFMLFLSYSKKQVMIFLFALSVGFMLGFFHLPLNPGKREMTGIVIKTGENYYVVYSEFRRYYVYEKSHDKELGDIIRYMGTVSKFVTANYESKFDFAAYLKEIGVSGELSVSSSSFVFKNPLRIRCYENWFVSVLNENGKGLVYAAVFNRKDYQNDLVAMASELNLVFAISSSGILYSWLLRIIEKRLKWKFDDEKAELIVLFIALLFLIPSFSKIGIRRVFLSRILRMVNRYLLKKRLDSITITSLSGIILILLNPYSALNSGLWIGLGASYAFIFSSGFIRHNFDYFKRPLANYVLLRLFLLPVTLSYTNGELPILSGLYSQLLLPITFLFQLLCYALMLLFSIRGMLSPISDGYYGLLKGLSYINPKLSFPPPSPVFYIFYYGVLIIVLLLLEVGFRKTPLVLSLGGIGVYLATLLPLPIWFTDQVSFINVGQGDSILIRDNDNVVLLDTGGNIRFDMAKEVLIPFFRKQRINHIDYLFISHGDFDHDGAKESLMESFKVDHLITSHKDFPIKIGGLEFASYNNIEESSDENDKSLVLSLNFMGKKWCFTGDAPIKVEREIIKYHPELDCDILKVGHHGSDTSTCPEWLDAITPEEAIISCGRNNSYGHPTAKVMEALRERGIKIRRTDIEGTITYRTFSFASL